MIILLKLKKILNFSSVKSPTSFYRFLISFLFLTGPIIAISQENSFFEKTKIQHKINEPITHPWISKSIEKAQKKVEHHNFEIRKQLLENTRTT